MKTVAVIDYGMGNLRSVAKAVEHVADANIKVLLTSEAKKIAEADQVIFPGQGAAKGCMDALRQHDLVELLPELATHKPFLGICMGLQVLFQRSDENSGTDCLGLISGGASNFADNPGFIPAEHKLPHMGWNQVQQQRSHPLWQGVADKAHFYFVHSYYVQPADSTLVMGTAHYGVEFVCAIGRENIFAVQFHPEKSAANGLKLLKNFIHWDGTI